MKRINAIFLTFIIILGSISAAYATDGNNNNISTTPAVVASMDKNWTSINYDSNMSRNSPQITINTTNVKQLVVKWKFNATALVENPPLIVGNNTYVQNNIEQIFALNLLTGKLIWKFDPKVNKSRRSHGMLYQNGIIYAPTGLNGTVIALNATNGHLLWQSPLIDSQKYYYNPSPPIIWKNYIIVGGGGGDLPALKGSVTALNKSSGKIIWHINTTVGSWVKGSNAAVNGGGTVWSGGAVDQNNGIIYLPVGNPSPDFNASTRKGNSSYTNDMIAVNITNGHIIWATPFIQVGTVLNVTLPDTHDWDTSWGSQLVTIQTIKGINKLVIGHDKYGDLMAMNATTGKPLWWISLHNLYNPPLNSTIFNYYGASDNNTLYIQDSPPSGNGTIAAIDMLTGKLKWKLMINAVITSPLITNGILFAGNSNTALTSGYIMALNKSSGLLLWQSNVGSLIGEGGPSIGQGMLLVPTFHGLYAFGLNNTINQSSSIIKANQSSPITKPNQTSQYNPTNKAKWAKTIHNNNGLLNKDPKSTVNNATIPMQKTGIPILPAILGLLIISGGIIERKLRK